MPFQMIDADQRHARDRGNRLRRHQPDQHPADQARPGRCRDARKLAVGHPGLRHGLINQPVHFRDMGTGGNFRHHAAERGMGVILRAHDIGENPLVPRHHGGGGLIAATLQPEDYHLSVWHLFSMYRAIQNVQGSLTLTEYRAS